MFEPIPSAWHVRQEEFPEEGRPAEKLRFCLRYAVLAPSFQNSQPWRFKVCGDRIALYVDTTRRIAYADPDLRQLVISCGAALFNLLVALRAFGYSGEIEERPDTADPDLLVSVGLGVPQPPTEADRKLFDSICSRHTNRLPFSERRIADETVEAIEAAAGVEGVWLQEVREGPMRAALADLIGAGDEEEMADPRFRREMAASIHRRGEYREDGIPEAAHGMPGLISYEGPQRARTFDTSALYAAREGQLVCNSPLLLVLGTPTDTRHDWLQVGQALAHLLLVATSWDVDASFVNSPIEVRDLRSKVAQTVGRSGYPQVILRLGYGEENVPTPRRSMAEVIDESP